MTIPIQAITTALSPTVKTGTDALSITNQSALQPETVANLSIPDRTLLAQTGSLSPEQILQAPREVSQNLPNTPAQVTAATPTLTEAVTFKPLLQGGDGLTLNLPPKEVEIYQDAGLRAATINGRPCLVRSDLDLSFKDGLGRTNLERMEAGLAPIDPQTKLSIEIHHIGQDPDGPLAELTRPEHRQGDNNLTLHPIRENSPVNHDVVWGVQRETHWISRANAA